MNYKTAGSRRIWLLPCHQETQSALTHSPNIYRAPDLRWVPFQTLAIQDLTDIVLVPVAFGVQHNLHSFCRKASQVALVVKNLSANAGDLRDMGSIPESGRSPGGGHGNPLQRSLLESPMAGGLQSTVSQSQTWLSASTRTQTGDTRAGLWQPHQAVHSEAAQHTCEPDIECLLKFCSLHIHLPHPSSSHEAGRCPTWDHGRCKGQKMLEIIQNPGWLEHRTHQAGKRLRVWESALDERRAQLQPPDSCEVLCTWNVSSLSLWQSDYPFYFLERSPWQHNKNEHWVGLGAAGMLGPRNKAAIIVVPEKGNIYLNWSNSPNGKKDLVLKAIGK